MNTIDRKLKQDFYAILCASFVTSIAHAADDPPAAKTTQSGNTRSALPAATATESKPQLQLKLSAADLDTIIAKHRPITTVNDSLQLEAVVVTSPAELAPMRSPARDVWGGLAAPFWAIAHPTQAWRIFLPIPPE